MATTSSPGEGSSMLDGALRALSLNTRGEGASPASSSSIKVIFLDIDGVICCNAIGRLEEEKLQRLRSVVSRTGAKVVLSTDWRRDVTLKSTLIKALTDLGISVIGSTRKGAQMQPIRPKEIISWLEGYAQSDKGKANPVSSWVAVDDRSLLNEQGGARLKGHFVNTTFSTGLTERLAERMVGLLEGTITTASRVDIPFSHSFSSSPTAHHSAIAPSAAAISPNRPTSRGRANSPSRLDRPGRSPAARTHLYGGTPMRPPGAALPSLRSSSPARSKVRAFGGR